GSASGRDPRGLHLARFAGLRAIFVTMERSGLSRPKPSHMPKCRNCSRVGDSRLSDFDYDLPEELIAQEPPAERDAARMLVLYRHEQRFEDRHFRELPSLLHEGDCLVLNDSRVLPSRLFGNRAGIRSLP